MPPRPVLREPPQSAPPRGAPAGPLDGPADLGKPAARSYRVPGSRARRGSVLRNDSFPERRSEQPAGRPPGLTGYNPLPSQPFNPGRSGITFVDASLATPEVALSESTLPRTRLRVRRAIPNEAMTGENAPFAGILSRDSRRNVLPVWLPTGRAVSPAGTTEDAICRHFSKTGATGLEPATSGVTGRVGSNNVRRRILPNGLIYRCFSPEPARASHG
jgi:hypothetical protein